MLGQNEVDSGEESDEMPAPPKRRRRNKKAKTATPVNAYFSAYEKDTSDESEFGEDGKSYIYVNNCSVLNEAGEICPLHEVTKEGKRLKLVGEVTDRNGVTSKIESKKLLSWFAEDLGKKVAKLGVDDVDSNYMIRTPGPQFSEIYATMKRTVDMASYLVLCIKRKQDLPLSDLVSAYFNQPDCKFPLVGNDTQEEIISNEADCLMTLVKSYTKIQGQRPKSWRFMQQLYAAKNKKELADRMATEYVSSLGEKSRLRNISSRPAIVASLYNSIFDQREHLSVENCEADILLSRATFRQRNRRGMITRGMGEGDFVRICSDQGVLAGIIRSVCKDQQTAHITQLIHGNKTILGNIGSEKEVFLLHECADIPFGAIMQKLFVSPLKYECCPDFGIFQDRQDSSFRGCGSCALDKNEEMFSKGLRLGKTKRVKFEEEIFTVGSFVRLAVDRGDPSNWTTVQLETESYTAEYKGVRPELWRSSNNRKSRSVLKTQQIGRIEEIVFKDKEEPTLQLTLFKRAGDFDPLEERKCHPNLLFATKKRLSVKMNSDNVAGKAYVACKKKIDGDINEWLIKGPNRFFVEKAINGHKFKPVELDAETRELMGDVDAKTGVPKPAPDWPVLENKLRTFDAFCGAGGMSLGLVQSGLSTINWGLDSNSECTGAFQENFPEAVVYNANLDDFIKLIRSGQKKDEDGKILPQKGEVDLVCGGPPCQGFTNLNRHPDSEGSKIKRDGMASFLSLVETLEPRFAFLENVTGVVTHQDGEYSRFAMQSLLNIGYQCNIGAISAAAFGVPQNRKRIFIIAAKVGEILPDFPSATHTSVDNNFRLKLNKLELENMIDMRGAPLREVWVEDVIGDLPNMSSVVKYEHEPTNPIQCQLRGDKTVLTEHVTKKLTDLELARLAFIPEGCNWTHLPNICGTLSDGTKTVTLTYQQPKISGGRGRKATVRKTELVKMKKCEGKQCKSFIPYSMAKTADKNSNWKESYARLARNKPFSITTTTFDLMGKVARIVHPTEDRCLTLRELARSQCFSDSFYLFGSFEDKCAQIGNAVPPPLSFHMGQMIMKSVLNKKED